MSSKERVCITAGARRLPTKRVWSVAVAGERRSTSHRNGMKYLAILVIPQSEMCTVMTEHSALKKIPSSAKQANVVILDSAYFQMLRCPATRS